MATNEEVDKLEEEAARKAMTPKPDPLEQDARAEIRRHKPESDEEREARQARNRQQSPDTKEPSTVLYPKGKPARMREKILRVGRYVRLDLQRGPCVIGKVAEIDTEMGSVLIQGPENSPSSLIVIHFKHIVRLEVFPD
jgi:hypothetical protein